MTNLISKKKQLKNMRAILEEIAENDKISEKNYFNMSKANIGVSVKRYYDEQVELLILSYISLENEIIKEML